MTLALEQARLAAEQGEVPVGAVIAHDGSVIATGHNLRETSNDPTAHAEIVALRQAAQSLSSWRLDGCVVAVTLEPCPMCAGALQAARVAKVIFGAADPKAGALGSLYNLGTDPRLNHEFEVVAGVMEAECGALLSDFFTARRT